LFHLFKNVIHQIGIEASVFVVLNILSHAVRDEPRVLKCVLVELVVLKMRMLLGVVLADGHDGRWFGLVVDIDVFRVIFPGDLLS
jgi:hypothetical protein